MILFHAPTHHNGIPSRKNKQSSSSSSLAGAKKKPIYTLISMEQPKYALILQNKKLLEESFDLLATYSLKNFYPGTSIPNLPLTYYPLHILALESILQQPKPFMHKNGYDTGRLISF